MIFFLHPQRAHLPLAASASRVAIFLEISSYLLSESPSVIFDSDNCLSKIINSLLIRRYSIFQLNSFSDTVISSLACASQFQCGFCESLFLLLIIFLEKDKSSS
eukprot:TRINITY_DN926_c1_g1_i1.p1 TRINITY_DN926_c1_g1~~TRINITY_DN926_c1_g1_i1.p1  ORF type:complete len:104 (+),score=11.44 TRINITY_DN926_c1_g1_i1:2-313(+)